jgi:hypothetical protein
MIGCCGSSNIDGVMKSLLVGVEAHKSLPEAEVKSSTTSRTCFAARVVDGMHPYFTASFLELHPLMELITGTQHCEKHKRISNKY